MSVIHTTNREFDQLVQLQIRPRHDWPAVFSCNPVAFSWPFVTFGSTRLTHRPNLFNKSRLLDEIVDAVLHARKEGGRLFVDHAGVFIKPVKNYILVTELQVEETPDYLF